MLIKTINPADGAQLVQLAEVLAHCQPLLAASSTTLRIFPVINTAGDASSFRAEDSERCNEILRAIGLHYSLVVPCFVWPTPLNASSLETALSKFLLANLIDWKKLAGIEKSNTLDAALSMTALPEQSRRKTLSPNNSPALTTFTLGTPTNEAIIFVLPCGMPPMFFHSWMKGLSQNHFVIMFENPYLFGDWRSLAEPACEITTEIEHIQSIILGYKLKRAHLIGICGGAPIAIAAAAVCTNRITSIFVLHGDLNFGPETPRTPFQRQFQSLLSEASTSLKHAAEVHSLFMDPAMLFRVPTELAPFILYPYADVGLFHRYAKINFALMAYDATAAAQQLELPMLIVANGKDRMTHPGASLMLHRLVNGSRLQEREAYSHHDALLINTDMLATITKFVGEAR
ncbi:putative aminoacrylate hydrolase RutD [compost metagenome]